MYIKYEIRVLTKNRNGALSSQDKRTARGVALEKGKKSLGLKKKKVYEIIRRDFDLIKLNTVHPCLYLCPTIHPSHSHYTFLSRFLFRFCLSFGEILEHLFQGS